MILGTYYKTASECPLSVFISVLVLEDVRKLRRSGIVPKSTLVDAYESIFDEYLKESNEEGYIILLNKLKDVAMLRNKGRLAGTTLAVLRMKYNGSLVEVLRMLGYRYSFDFTDKEKYYFDLEKVAKEVKKIADLIKGLEEEHKKKAKKEVAEGDFDGILGQLSKFQGYRIDKKEVTVREFLEIFKNFKRENKPKSNGK
jgi:hypothetical protein